MLHKVVAVLGIMAASFDACAATTATQASANAQANSQLTLDVAPERRACTGEGARLCLVVRADGDSTWKNFFDPIEGFTHETGFRYRIVVDRTTVARPPADGSAYRYRLVRVLSREKAG